VRRTSVSCSATRSHSTQRLAALYPSHAAFVAKFNQAADAIERAGFWLKPEADDAKKAAEASSIGGR